MGKITKYLVACFILLLAITINSSFSNKNKYYIKVTDGAVEIWQGKFAPMGADLLATLPGAQSPELIQAVYSKKEVFPFAFNYYIDRADALLDTPDMPDFEGIKLYLNKALSFGTTPDLTKAAYNRLNSIELMILMYKADVAASKGTIFGFETALEHLNKAALLELNNNQTELIKQKIKSVRTLIAGPETKQPEAEQSKALSESKELIQ
ncbi:MAG: hypothetical protein JRD93_00390 [Deltaproteobacteria bacterium]|nr:hypothetical protein [Deltaproteobacteria bacterium]MBW2660463.1 hypothetical protein [Deltaproteobacteria bacterium]